MKKGTSTRGVSRVLDQIKTSNSHGFQAEAARQLNVSRTMVSGVVAGRMKSERVATGLVKLWPAWVKAQRKGGAAHVAA